MSFPQQKFSKGAVNPGHVKIWGTEYKPGSILVLKVESYGVLHVGLLISIVVDKKSVFFLCDVFKAELGKSNCYCSTEKLERNFYKYSCLADFRPLLRRGSLESFCFLLHNYVSEH